MRKNRLLIVFFLSVTTLSGVLSSCTYDYFEDETNYTVFVPGVAADSVTDCRVMVYSENGTLVKERYAARPWGGDPRIQRGIFAFRLPPGSYKVYCYTNTDSIRFSGTEALDAAAFTLKSRDSGSSGLENNEYAEPSNILYELLSPSIIHPGICVTDTARMEKYTGRITVRFKNFPVNTSSIKEVNLRALGAGVFQPLKDVVHTSRKSPNDVMSARSGLEVPLSPPGQTIEVDNLFLPTVDDGQMVTLEYTFADASGATVITLSVELKDRGSGLPLELNCGERIIIEIDAYTIINIDIVGWDEDIQTGDTNLG